MFHGNNLPASPEDLQSALSTQNSMPDDAKEEEKYWLWRHDTTHSLPQH
jgi:hypothetical protein